jgi:outer membrane lipoprotein SlyB
MFRVVLMAATAVALVGCARSESATEAAFRADDAVQGIRRQPGR